MSQFQTNTRWPLIYDDNVAGLNQQVQWLLGYFFIIVGFDRLSLYMLYKGMSCPFEWTFMDGHLCKR